MKTQGNIFRLPALVVSLKYTEEDYVYQVALYLLIWGEANNVRFMPECLCFIFQCALDCNGPNLPKFNYLNRVITPLYEFIRDQLYCKVDNKWKRREIDHACTIGYDDINQLFWSPEGLYKLIFMMELDYINYHKPNGTTN